MTENGAFSLPFRELMVGANQQAAKRFPFPKGADEESAVCAPYSAIKVACGAFTGK